MTEEGFIFPRGFASRFHVGRSAGQNIPNNVITVVEWDLQRFDELEEMAIVNPWAFTPRQHGWYWLHAHVRFNALPIGAVCYARFYMNGVADVAADYQQAANLNENITLKIGGIAEMDQTDSIDVRVYHLSGIVRSIQGNWVESAFFGFRVA